MTVKFDVSAKYSGGIDTGKFSVNKPSVPQPLDKESPRWKFFSFKFLQDVQGALKTAKKSLKPVRSTLEGIKSLVGVIQGFVGILSVFESILNVGLWTFVDAIIDQMEEFVNDFKSTGFYFLDLTSYHWKEGAPPPIQGVNVEEYKNALAKAGDVMQMKPKVALKEAKKTLAKIARDKTEEEKKYHWHTEKISLQMFKDFWGKYTYKRETYFEFIGEIANAFVDEYDVPEVSLWGDWQTKFNPDGPFLKNKTSPFQTTGDFGSTGGLGVGGVGGTYREKMLGNDETRKKYGTHFNMVPPRFLRSGKPEFGDDAHMDVFVFAFAFPDIREIIRLINKIREYFSSFKFFFQLNYAPRLQINTLYQDEDDSGHPKEPNFLGITAYTLIAPAFEAIEWLISMLKSYQVKGNTGLTQMINDILEGINTVIDKLMILVDLIDAILSFLEELSKISGLYMLHISTEYGTQGVINQLKNSKGFYDRNVINNNITNMLQLVDDYQNTIDNYRERILMEIENANNALAEKQTSITKLLNQGYDPYATVDITMSKHVKELYYMIQLSQGKIDAATANKEFYESELELTISDLKEINATLGEIIQSQENNRAITSIDNKITQTESDKNNIDQRIVNLNVILQACEEWADYIESTNLDDLQLNLKTSNESYTSQITELNAEIEAQKLLEGSYENLIIQKTIMETDQEALLASYDIAIQEEQKAKQDIIDQQADTDTADVIDYDDKIALYTTTIAELQDIRDSSITQYNYNYTPLDDGISVIESKIAQVLAGTHTFEQALIDARHDLAVLRYERSTVQAINPDTLILEDTPAMILLDGIDAQQTVVDNAEQDVTNNLTEQGEKQGYINAKKAEIISFYSGLNPDTEETAVPGEYPWKYANLNPAWPAGEADWIANKEADAELLYDDATVGNEGVWVLESELAVLESTGSTLSTTLATEQTNLTNLQTAYSEWDADKLQLMIKYQYLIGAYLIEIDKQTFLNEIDTIQNDMDSASLLIQNQIDSIFTNGESYLSVLDDYYQQTPVSSDKEFFYEYYGEKLFTLTEVLPTTDHVLKFYKNSSEYITQYELDTLDLTIEDGVEDGDIFQVDIVYIDEYQAMAQQRQFDFTSNYLPQLKTDISITAKMKYTALGGLIPTNLYPEDFELPIEPDAIGNVKCLLNGVEYNDISLIGNLVRLNECKKDDSVIFIISISQSNFEWIYGQSFVTVTNFYVDPAKPDDWGFNRDNEITITTLYNSDIFTVIGQKDLYLRNQVVSKDDLEVKVYESTDDLNTIIPLLQTDFELSLDKKYITLNSPLTLGKLVHIKANYDRIEELLEGQDWTGNETGYLVRFRGFDRDNPYYRVEGNTKIISQVQNLIALLERDRLNLNRIQGIYEDQKKYLEDTYAKEKEKYVNETHDPLNIYGSTMSNLNNTTSLTKDTSASDSNTTILTGGVQSVVSGESETVDIQNPQYIPLNDESFTLSDIYNLMLQIPFQETGFDPNKKLCYGGFLFGWGWPKVDDPDYFNASVMIKDSLTDEDKESTVLGIVSNGLEKFGQQSSSFKDTIKKISNIFK